MPKDQWAKEIAAAEEEAAKRYPKYSVEYYNEMEKCDAFCKRRAAWWRDKSISKGW